MATFTQDRQPYGPLVRRTFVVDSTTYDVVRGDLSPSGRKWSLRRTGVAGRADAFVYLPEERDGEGAMRAAKRRLLG